MAKCLIFSVCYFWLFKKWCLQNFCLIKKWMMLEVVDKSAFEAITLPDNLVLVCRFQGCNLVFSSLYMICEICELESWNMNHELLNQTLTRYPKLHKTITNKVSSSQKPQKLELLTFDTRFWLGLSHLQYKFKHKILDIVNPL